MEKAKNAFNRDEVMHSDRQNRMVYLLGIMPRSGTNYLNDLLCLHPDCGSTVRVSEDFLLANAEHLLRYVKAAAYSWQSIWNHDTDALQAPLLRALGSGLESFLYGLTEEHWVADLVDMVKDSPGAKVLPPVCISRTPSVQNLELLPLLTEAQVVVLIRDGRSVVESGMRSFGWLFEDAARRWASAARTILQADLDDAQMLCVNFEALITDKTAVLHDIFQFLHIDPQTYDYSEQLPVRGSSTFYDKAKGFNWNGTPATHTFNPLVRWQSWGRFRHARFNWLAGKELIQLGYEPEPVAGFYWPMVNRMLDIIWPLQTMARRLARVLLPRRMRAHIMWYRSQRYRQGVNGRS